MAGAYALGDAAKDVAIALRSLPPEQQRRVLIACLILLGHKVPIEFLEMDDSGPRAGGEGNSDE